jgi:eukaryotic-like serine/threonine-protein kinase
LGIAPFYKAPSPGGEGPDRAIVRAMAGQSPTRIGRYEIRQELGRGMMGIVYLADDSLLGRPVALKTIQLAFVTPEADRDSFEKRFLGEARVAAGLAHPGIVVVHDVGRDPGTGILYIALEYLRGSTLAEVTASGAPLDWREALRITARLARALHHAHAAGVIHRDVKPANVMLLPSGEVKVMDFGIAKVPQQDLTATGQFFGTPLYMSPEQARGEAVDGRSDLFALGAITYRLLTGRAAFGAENVTAILSRVLTDNPAPPSTLVPQVPPDADYVVARTLSKSPADRYPDGETLAQDVDDILEGRAPRHRKSWSALTAVPGTMVPRPAPDDESLLPELLPIPAEAAPPRIARGQDPANPRLKRAALAVGAALLLLAGLLAGVTFEKRLPVTPASDRAEAPRPARMPAQDRVVSRPAPPALAEHSDEPGRLAIDFDHHLRSGTLRVWIDDQEALDQGFGGKVKKKILSLRIRKGSVDEVLQVAPGRHEVRVEVQWDGNARSESIFGAFKPGATRTLEIRILRVLNVLTLEWR